MNQSLATSPQLWCFEDTIAREIAAAASTDLHAPAAELVAAMHRWIPSGSTAKHEAVTAGRLPPGAAPLEIAEQVLAGSTHSWTCWAASTVTAALLAAAGHHSEVVAELRFGPDVQPWDVHAVVLVDGAAMADPCLGPSALVPLGGTHADDTAHAQLGGHPAGWSHDVRVPGRPMARYRCLARHLGAVDVQAFLAVSVTHTGVRADRLNLRCPVPGGVMAVRSHSDGTSSSSCWTRRHDTWTETARTTGQFQDLVDTALAARAAGAMVPMAV